MNCFFLIASLFSRKLTNHVCLNSPSKTVSIPIWRFKTAIIVRCLSYTQFPSPYHLNFKDCTYFQMYWLLSNWAIAVRVLMDWKHALHAPTTTSHSLRRSARQRRLQLATQLHHQPRNQRRFPPHLQPRAQPVSRRQHQRRSQLHHQRCLLHRHQPRNLRFLPPRLQPRIQRRFPPRLQPRTLLNCQPVNRRLFQLTLRPMHQRQLRLLLLHRRLLQRCVLLLLDVSWWLFLQLCYQRFQLLLQLHQFYRPRPLMLLLPSSRTILPVLRPRAAAVPVDVCKSPLRNDMHVRILNARRKPQVIATKKCFWHVNGTTACGENKKKRRPVGDVYAWPLRVERSN
jgi:hypothetical protein